MKEVSKYSREWSISGQYQIVRGAIIVTMNYTTQNYVYNNPSTHDEETRTRYIHKVESFINDKPWMANLELINEASVISEVEQIKKSMDKDMEYLSNLKPEKTFSEKMSDLGFIVN